MSLIQASAANIPLAAKSVHMVATSPPYWGLRKYEGRQGVDWEAVEYVPMAGLPPITIPAMHCELGLESAPEAYIGHLVAAFREVRRVLRDDGTVWLNLGDSFWGGKGQSGHADPERQAERVKRGESFNTVAAHVGGYGAMRPQDGKHPGLKPKDLIGIPWRAAFALQADGWWLRSDIIWGKPACMPESVTDRPTKAHEYIFLLAKSRRYYYDAAAVVEESASNGKRVARPEKMLSKGQATERGTQPTRNLRSVWHIATQPFSGSHFAVWPPALVEPMIKAGTSECGCCPQCGASWKRIVERTPMVIARSGRAEAMGEYGRTQSSGTMLRPAESVTIGWQPTCACGNPDTVPCIVLDPFAGSGTTGVVARNLGRRFIGLDVSGVYLRDIARPRISVEFGAAKTRRAAGHKPLENLPLFAKETES